MALSPGTRLGPYEILAPLGSGGMGEVYRARDAKLRRDVAIKVLPDNVSAEPDRVARFEREALAVAALSHPNILAIHDFGRDRGIQYAVTELLVGQTLRDVLRTGSLPPPKAIGFGLQIARALQAAHGGGIVHRDLKPENVFVAAGGHIKILDFGLAKAAPPGPGDDEHGATETGVASTQAGTVLGTPGYMAPEQIRGSHVDRRADIFAFGCVLYEMLVGRRAFHGDSSIDTLHATLHSDPPDLLTLAEVPDALLRIVARCLAKQPAERFQSAGDVAFALESVDPTPSSRPAGPQPAATPARRAFRPALPLAILTVLATIGTAVWWRLSTAATPATTSAPTTTAPRGIAVLPFENLGEADQAYFAAGVTEEVTLQLAKLSSLRVMSRNAVARFENGAAALPAMSRELGVAAVLTGTVRHSGEQVRVGVQLLAAPSGETLWGEQYDRTLANIFDVQSDIAVRVARALQASLAPDERARIERAPTNNTAAYELFLQQQRLSLISPQQNAEGIALLQKAIDLDPRFALAHATLARRILFRGRLTGREDYLLGVQTARKAIELDPQLPRAHYALGVTSNRAGFPDEARLAMLRAIELDPNYTTAMNDLSLLELIAGRVDQSFYWAKRAYPLAPNLATQYYHLALPLIVLDDQLAERLLQAGSRRFAPDDAGGGMRLAIQLAAIDFGRGNASAAAERMRHALAAAPTSFEGQRALMESAVYAGAPDAGALVDAVLRTSAATSSFYGPYPARVLRAFLWSRAGQPDRARPLIDAAMAETSAAIAGGDRSFRPHYVDAALHLMRGDRSAALDAWERAIDAGMREHLFLRRDPLLAPLASEPRFIAAMARVDRDVDAMRQRVDVREIDAWIGSGSPPR
jgi:serine/threonine protein kinase/tetratricopeptide (TPR) repeat protein